MNHRTTVVLLVLFFTGLIVLWWADYAGVPTSEERRRLAGRVLPALIDTPVEDIQRAEIVRDGGRIVFERRGEGLWQMVEPLDAAADPGRVDGLVRMLKDLAPVPDAGTLEGDSASYGLDGRAPTVRLFGADPKTPLAALEVGGVVGDLRYVRPVGEAGVEVVEAPQVGGLDTPAAGWRDRAIFRIPTFQVGGVKVEGPGRDLEAGRDREDGHWSLVRPFRTTTDEAKMEEMLAGLVSLAVAAGDEGFVADGVTDFAPYGLASPSATIELSPLQESAPSQTLLLGKEVPGNPDRLYARRGDQDDVVAIDAAAVREVGRSPEAVRGQRVADINPARATYARVEALGLVFELARTLRGWELIRPSPAAADQEAVRALLDGLAGLTSAEFLDPSAVTEPMLDPAPMAVRVWQGPPGVAPSAGDPPVPHGEPRLDLRMGRHDVLKKAVYGRLDGDSKILALPDSILDVLPKNALAYRDRVLMTVAPTRVDELTVRRAEGTYRLAASGGPGGPPRWRMTAPVEGAADEASIERALQVLAPLRAERLVAEGPASADLKAFGLDDPGLTLGWSLSGGAGEGGHEAGELLVAKRGPAAGTYYAKLGGRDLVFALGAAQIQPLLAEFRDHNVLSFAPAKVEGVELIWPGLRLGFDRVPAPPGGKTSWKPTPRSEDVRFDHSRLDALVSSMARLETPRFLQYAGPIPDEAGLSPPQLEVVVRLSDPEAGHRLRVGEAGPEGQPMATLAAGGEGAVFLLSGTGWGELVKPPERASEFPEDVFAPCSPLSFRSW